MRTYMMHTYLQKTSRTSDQVLQDRPEKLDQKDCSVGCWALSVAAAAVAFAHQQSPAILAAQIPRCWHYLRQ